MTRSKALAKSKNIATKSDLQKKSKKRWKEYIEDLYDKHGKPNLDQFNFEEEENVGIDEMGPESKDTGNVKVKKQKDVIKY